MTLQSTGFTFKEPVPIVEDEEEFEEIDDDDIGLDTSGVIDEMYSKGGGSAFSGMGGDIDEDEGLGMDDDDDDDDFLATEYGGKGKEKAEEEHGGGGDSLMGSSSGVGGGAVGGVVRSADERILLPSKSAQEWKLEYERVRSGLKLQIVRDNKDWRSHHGQLKEHESVVGQSLAETKTKLEKFGTEINKGLDAIRSRERIVNDNCQDQGMEYQAAKERLEETKNEYKQTRQKVDMLTNELDNLSTLLSEVKEQTERKESNMTDQQPVVRIKKSLAGIKKEIKDMELRIGVLEHTLSVGRIKKKNAMDSSIRDNKENGETALEKFMAGSSSKNKQQSSSSGGGVGRVSGVPASNSMFLEQSGGYDYEEEESGDEYDQYMF
eukprot:TRINITY_DN504_c0_g1_i3.p2 TRINITY_DN504_c0_g1~~TRINITY_DN504_c0_g1_i3.p2  ORF type:complete len:379 (+),score=177.05 TRINITY_DN504_c0_g1_i3:2110-3246(+)